MLVSQWVRTSWCMSLHVHFNTARGKKRARKVQQWPTLSLFVSSGPPNLSGTTTTPCEDASSVMNDSTGHCATVQ